MWPGASIRMYGRAFRAEEDARRVDGDSLGLLVLQRVEQERVLERLAVALAVGTDGFELTGGKRAGVGQQAADNRALAVVHVSADDEMQAASVGRDGEVEERGGSGVGGDGHGLMFTNSVRIAKAFSWPTPISRIPLASDSASPLRATPIT